MIYNKNKAIVTGKVFKAGYTIGNSSIILLEVSTASGATSLVPVTTDSLKQCPKINTNVTVEGIIKVVNYVPFIEATSVTPCKKGKQSQIIDITGNIERDLGKGKYIINNGVDTFQVRIPLKDDSLVKEGEIAHLSCIIISPMFLNKAVFDLTKFRLMCTHFTNL